jgi:hypothetical protein
MDDFIARAEAEVARLREEDDHLAATEQGIQSRRAELAKQVVAAGEAIDYYRHLMGRAEVAAEALVGNRLLVTVGAPRERGADRPATIGNRAEDYMDAHGGEADVNDLRDDLMAHGASGNEKDVYRKIYATLLRDSRFYRVSPGRFGLLSRKEATSSSSGSFLVKAAAESWDGDLGNVVRAIATQETKPS